MDAGIATYAATTELGVIILDLADRELRTIMEFDSRHAASAELAAGHGDAHVHVVDVRAGGEIGPHDAGFGQLFVCLAGDGWIAAADGVRVPLHQGQAAYVARGERHSKGSETGLRALIVQVHDLEPLPVQRDVGVSEPRGLPPATTAHGVVIRLYHPADNAEWLRMRRMLFPDIAPGDEVEDAAAWLARPDTVVIVAARPQAARLVGFAELGARAYADGCDTTPVAYLEGWYVDHDLRRQGIGSALVRTGEVWARQHGYRELASDALVDNTTSHAAHLALGFVEVERAVHYRKALQ
jgi:aminoglycoside 6'-N-acetyltransferase I